MTGGPEPRGRTRLRVRYPETDRMRVAWHGHYFAWFELGRTELMRELGSSYADLEEQGVFFPVREAGSRYLRSARYDEWLTVETRLTCVGGAHVRFDYVIISEGDGRELARGFTEHACVNGSGRPMRLPADLRSRLESESRP